MNQRERRTGGLRARLGLPTPEPVGARREPEPEPSKPEWRRRTESGIQTPKGVHGWER